MKKNLKQNVLNFMFIIQNYHKFQLPTQDRKI